MPCLEPVTVTLVLSALDNYVPFAVVADNVDDWLELLWISGQDVSVIGFPDASDTDRADPKPRLEEFAATRSGLM